MIGEDKVKEYWNNRSEQQGKRTVGYANTPMSQQDEQYKQHREFLFPYTPTNLKTLDYGCGIGRYSYIFEQYIGVDITKNLLDIAIKDNPLKTYKLLEDPYLPEMFFNDFEMFFTATVLQHNSDQTVHKIIESVKKNKEKDILFALYENAQAQSYHVKKRTTEDYANIINQFFEIKSISFKSHTICNELHTISLIQT